MIKVKIKLVYKFNTIKMSESTVTLDPLFEYGYLLDNLLDVSKDLDKNYDYLAREETNNSEQLLLELKCNIDRMLQLIHVLNQR
jgi:hypothetical protein